MVLPALSESQGYAYDKETELLFGKKNGYLFAVQAQAQNQFTLYFSVKTESGAVDDNHGKALAKESKPIGSAGFKQYKLTCSIKVGMTKKKTRENILQALEDVTAYLSLHQFVNCCEVTGKTDDVALYIAANRLVFLAPEAYAQMSSELDGQSQETMRTKENVFLGAIGAFLGSLIGVAAIVIIGQLGYVSMISGIIMGVCAIKGYELFAKRISLKGAVISAIIIVLMTFFANQLDWSFTIARYFDVSVFEVLPVVHELVADGSIDSSVYIQNLLLIYLTTIISAGVMIWTSLKSQATKFDIRKLY